MSEDIFITTPRPGLSFGLAYPSFILKPRSQNFNACEMYSG